MLKASIQIPVNLEVKLWLRTCERRFFKTGEGHNDSSCRLIKEPGLFPFQIDFHKSGQHT